MNGCEFGGTNPTVSIVGTNYFNISQSGPPGIGRNSFRGPGYFSTDATLSKRFALPMLSEAAGIELRAFAFNVFNQLNLAPFAFGGQRRRMLKIRISAARAAPSQAGPSNYRYGSRFNRRISAPKRT